MMHWLAHWMGLDNGSGMPYLFWSGIGANLGEVAIIGGLVTMYRRHVCHQKGCYRIGRQQIDGTTYVVCRAHHPDDERGA